MKYAAAMRFGGSLVEAVECDYEDYKYLGLLCPECKDPVFLRAEAKRQQNGKEVKIGAHFAHFPGKDASLIAQCESRVSKYSHAEIQRAIAKAKGQRLRLLQRFYLQCLDANEYAPIWKECEEMFKDHLLQSDPSVLELVKSNKTLSFMEVYFYREVKTLLSNWENICKWLKDGQFEKTFRSFLQTCEGEYGEWMKKTKMLQTFEQKSHVSICLEVIDFLSSSKNQEALKHTFLLAIQDYMSFKYGDDDVSSARYSTSDESVRVCLHFALIIGTTPWADEFAKLQKRNNAKGDKAA